MDGLLNDLRLAWRNLRRGPAYTVVAVATLVLGIGVNVTIFSLVNGFFFKQIPGIADPDRLVNVSRVVGGDYWDMSYPIVRAVVEQSAQLEDAATLALAPVSLSTADGAPSVLMSMSVSGNYFDILGLVPSAGAFFDRSQTFPTAAPVAVISHDLWQRRFNGRADIVGSSVLINGQAVRITGVSPRGFKGHGAGLRVDIFLALGLSAPGLLTPDGLHNAQSSIVEVVGRLANGATAASAAAELTQTAGQVAIELIPNAAPDSYRVRVDPYSPVPGPIRSGVTIFVSVLMSVVGLVLLMACTNVAGMFLFRSVQRRSELAIRQALGASRWRVMRLLMVESLLLFLIAGVVAIIAANWATGLLLTFEPPTPPGYAIDLNLSLDWRVASYAIVITVACGVLFGLTPALRAARTDMPSMRADATAAPQRTRLRSVLVFGQTSITVLLLIAAGLFLRAITSLELLDTGWVADDVHVVTMDVQLNGTDEDRGRIFYGELLDRVSRVPGVQSASLAAKLPLAGSSSLGAVNAEGTPAPPGRFGHDASFNRVSPDYFATLRIPLLRGRDFTTADGPHAPDIAVINRAMAVRLFGDVENAVGRQFSVGPVGEGLSFQVVGVVEDAKYNRLTEDARNFFYVPHSQRYNSQMSLHARVLPGADRPALEEIGRVIHELDNGLPVEPMRPLEENLEVFFLPQRMAAWVSGLMGGLGLILAAVGVYGISSFGAAQRRREMGIRMALGARPADVIRLIVGQGLIAPVVGIGTGLAIAFGVTRFLSSLLAGISPLDPVAFTTVVALLGLVALAAVATPAISAARSDPVASLRTD